VNQYLGGERGREWGGRKREWGVGGERREARVVKLTKGERRNIFKGSLSLQTFVANFQ
jgi:hypothetical protein